MKIARIALGAALMCAVAWAAVATAQDRYGRNDRTDRYDRTNRYDRYGRYNDVRNRDNPSAPTSVFLRQAALGGMAEVSMGMLARRRASDTDVRDFADQMVQDHSQANAELRQLARDKGWALPSNLDAAHRAALTRLRQRTGAWFDRQYMREMVRDHQVTVTMFRNYARNGADPDLRDWASRTLPTLLEHSRMANDTEGTMNAGYQPGRRY